MTTLPRVWLKMSAGERRPNGDVFWKIQAPCRFMGFVPELVPKARINYRVPFDAERDCTVTAQEPPQWAS